MRGIVNEVGGANNLSINIVNYSGTDFDIILNKVAMIEVFTPDYHQQFGLNWLIR